MLKQGPKSFTVLVPFPRPRRPDDCRQHLDGLAFFQHPEKRAASFGGREPGDDDEGCLGDGLVGVGKEILKDSCHFGRVQALEGMDDFHPLHGVLGPAVEALEILHRLVLERGERQQEKGRGDKHRPTRLGFPESWS